MTRVLSFNPKSRRQAYRNITSITVGAFCARFKPKSRRQAYRNRIP